MRPIVARALQMVAGILAAALVPVMFLACDGMFENPVLDEVKQQVVEQEYGPPPAAPQIASIEPGYEELTVEWVEADRAVSYEVWYSVSPTEDSAGMAAADLGGTSYTVGGLAIGMTYYVWVRGISPSGAGPYSEPASGTPVAYPGRASITDTVVGDQQIAIRWSSVSGADAYEVWFGTVSDPSSATRYGDPVTETGGADYTVSVTGLVNGTEYHFWVRATNSAGPGEYSDEAVAVPNVVPATPSHAPLVDPGLRELLVSWSEIETASSYELWISTQNSSATASRYGEPIEGTSWTIGGLDDGTQYFVWLKARNSAGASDLSPPGSGTTVPPVPAAPALTGGSGQVDVSWSAVDGASAYEVWYNDSSDWSTAQRSGSEVTGTSATVSGLAAGTRYYVWIRATNSAGASDASSPSSTWTIPPSPSAPSLSEGYERLTVSWAAVNGATAYEVWYGTSSSSSDASKYGADSTGTSRTISGLTTRTRYYVWIKAKNGSGTSSFGSRAYASPYGQGSIDLSFETGTSGVGFAWDGGVYAVAVQDDGKIVIGGDFSSYRGTSRTRVARINPDGTLDTSFNPGSGANNTVRTVAIRDDGRILIGGDFTTVGGLTRRRIALLDADGSVASTSVFDAGYGANDIVTDIEIDSFGRIIVAGDFTSMGGYSRSRVARLYSNGAVDSGAFTSGANSLVTCIEIQSDGKVLLGGFFTTYAGASRSRIARVSSTGVLDSSFSGHASDDVNGIVAKSNGRIVIGGMFTSYDGETRKYVAQLLSDGSVDTSFYPLGSGLDLSVTTLEQWGGYVYAGGYFTDFSGDSRNHVTDISMYGDPGWMRPGSGANDVVYDIAGQSDGKLILVGSFSSYDGHIRPGIVRVWGD